jgi:hypothetical protein
VATTTTERASPSSPRSSHLAAALADQADDVDVGRGVARQHRHHHRLADARAGEDAHALAAAAADEGVERAHPEVELGADPAAGMGGRRGGAQRLTRPALGQRALAVDRLAQRIDDPAEPGLHRVDRRLGLDHPRPAAETDAVERAQRHDQRAFVAEADHLARYDAAAARLDQAASADRQAAFDAADLHHQAIDRGHPAVDGAVLDRRQIVEQKVDRARHGSRPSFPGPGRLCGHPGPSSSRPVLGSVAPIDRRVRRRVGCRPAAIIGRSG